MKIFNKIDLEDFQNNFMKNIVIKNNSQLQVNYPFYQDIQLSKINNKWHMFCIQRNITIEFVTNERSINIIDEFLQEELIELVKVINCLELLKKI